jgi:PDDEXK-like domain of unknown function (DUF3799)
MIKNAKIIGIGANPKDYHAPQKAKRGTVEHIMSVSSLRLFGQCPSRYLAGYEMPNSDAKDDGNLFDTRLLTPELFDARYVDTPEEYTEGGMQCPICLSVTDSQKCAKCKVPRVAVQIIKDWRYGSTFCDDWRKHQLELGKEPVNHDALMECDIAIERFMSDEVIRAFMEDSDRQVHVAAEWHDEKTGLVIPLRALMDLVPRLDTEFCKCVGDVKRTRNAAPMAWQRWCFQAGYWIQAAFYLSMLSAAEGSDRNTFCFLLSENYPPYEPGKRMLDQDFLTLGRQEYTRLLENYCACIKAGKFPGYDDTDESVQGWGLVSPDPYQSERMMFAPRFNFDSTEPAEDSQSDEIIP